MHYSNTFGSIRFLKSRHSAKRIVEQFFYESGAWNPLKPIHIKGTIRGPDTVSGTPRYPLNWLGLFPARRQFSGKRSWLSICLSGFVQPCMANLVEWYYWKFHPCPPDSPADLPASPWFPFIFVISWVHRVSYLYTESLFIFTIFQFLRNSRLKSVEAIKLEFVVPMPEQIATNTMQFFKVSGKLCMILGLWE